MPLVIPDNACSLAIEYTANAGTGPFYVTCGVARPTEAPLQEVVNYCFDQWLVAWEDLTFSQFTFERAILSVSLEGGGIGSVISNGSPITGGAEGDPAVVGAAVLINKNTGLLGRKGRGRMFVPGLLGEADIDVNGNISPSTAALYQTAIDAWEDAMDEEQAGWSGSPRCVLLHSEASLPITDIESFTVTTKIGWQRKRLR